MIRYAIFNILNAEVESKMFVMNIQAIGKLQVYYRVR